VEIPRLVATIEALLARGAPAPPESNRLKEDA
jgi:hypothetical protein